MVNTMEAREKILNAAYNSMLSYSYDGAAENAALVRESLGELLDGCSISEGQSGSDDYTREVVTKWIIFDEQMSKCGNGGSVVELYANLALDGVDGYILRISSKAVKVELLNRIVTGNAVDKQREIDELRAAGVIE